MKSKTSTYLPLIIWIIDLKILSFSTASFKINLICFSGVPPSQCHVKLPPYFSQQRNQKHTPYFNDINKLMAEKQQKTNFFFFLALNQFMGGKPCLA